MKTPDLDRIRYVTRHLGDLQASVKLGLLMGLGILSGGLASYFRNPLWFLLQLASLAGLLFVQTHPQGYLEARFGRAEKKQWAVPNGVKDLILLGVVVLTCLPIYFVPRWPNVVSFLSDRLIYLLFSAMFLFRFIYREYRLAEAYNLGIFALFLAIATRGASPTLTPPAWLWNHSGMSWILYGSALILTGLVDYWQLARTLPPIAEESEALATKETR